MIVDMMEMNYKPKFYDCILNGIRTEGSKHLFHLTEKNTDEKIKCRLRWISHQI